jgi:hypothetical protein
MATGAHNTTLRRHQFEHSGEVVGRRNPRGGARPQRRYGTSIPVEVKPTAASDCQKLLTADGSPDAPNQLTEMCEVDLTDLSFDRSQTKCLDGQIRWQFGNQRN